MPASGGAQVAVGSADAADVSTTAGPPPIEHITQNYVTLQSLVAALVDRSIRELQTVLRTLPAAPSDAARKRTLLQFIVGVREEFVKLFVLCKWAVVAPEISRAVDVANWLRVRHLQFENVVGALWQLQQALGPAKMPWADLETALQVLRDGEPLAPAVIKARGWSPALPLGADRILQVLKRLDVLLAVRLALTERLLPPAFRGYSIKDGRVRFTAAGSFWVELGVASEAPDARFFLVDFGLTATGGSGINKKTKMLIETVVNEQLNQRALAAVLGWLQTFASVYRLQLLAMELAKLETGVWAGLLRHRLHRAALTINFWTQRPEQSHEIRVFVGSDRRLATDATDEGVDLFAEHAIVHLLKQVVSRKARELIAPLVGCPGVRLVADAEIEVLLGSGGRSARIGVDVVSGLFVVKGGVPSQLALRVQESLNSEPSDKLPAALASLRVHAQQEVLTARAEAAGWDAKPSLHLAPGEISKLDIKRRETTVLALRRPEWAPGWFLCVLFQADNRAPLWLATRLTFHARRWHFGPIHTVEPTGSGDSGAGDDADYDTLDRLAAMYRRRFALYELARALGTTSTETRRTLQGNALLVDLTTLLPAQEVLEWSFSGLRCCVSDDEDSVLANGCARPGCIDALVGTSATAQYDITVRASGEYTLKVSDLAMLRTQLVRLHRIARSLTLARRSAVDVLSASLNDLQLAYGPDNKGSLILRVPSDPVEPGPTGASASGLPVIEFASGNPQQILAPFLPPLVARLGLARVVRYLSDSFGLWESLQNLQWSQGLIVLPQTAASVTVQRSSESEKSKVTITFGHWRGQAQLFIKTSAVVRMPGVLALGEGLALPVSMCEKVLEQVVATL